MIKNLTSIDDFEEIAEQWNQFIWKHDEPNPSLVSEFVLSWWNLFNKSKKLQIYYSEDQCLGLPAYSYRPFKYFFRNVLRVIGDGASNYSESFSNDINSNIDLLNLITQNNTYDFIRFDRVRKNSNFFCALDNFRSDKFMIIKKKIGFTYCIENISDVDNYMLELPKKTRYHLRKGLKIIEGSGGLDIRQPNSLKELGEYFEAYVNLAVDSFRKRGKRNSFENSNFAEFYIQFFQQLFNRSLLDCYVLKYNNDYLAIHFGVKTPNTLHYILTAHNNKYGELSPGHILIYTLLKNLGSKKRLDLHFGRNVLYKKQWANKTEDVYEIFMLKKNIVNKTILRMRERQKR